MRLAVTAPSRTLLLRLNGARLWRWQVDLAARLARHPGVRLRVEVVEGPALPAAVAVLATLERLVFRLKGPQNSDLLPAEALASPQGAAGAPADLVLDLSGRDDPAPRGTPVLRLLYDGAPSDTAALVAALDGRSPALAVVDVTGAGGAHAVGLPAVENVHVLTLALGSIFAAAQALCLKAIDPGGEPGPAGMPAPVPALPPAAVLRFGARTLWAKLQVRLARLCGGDTQWFVAWRTQAAGDPPLALGELGHYRRLPDDGGRYYADPFLFAAQGETFLFVEEFPFASPKGIISAARLGPNGFGPPRPVLEAGSHLSYPHVFAHGGAVWMIPESMQAGTVELYRAERLPDRWVHEATLLDGIAASDATVFRHDGAWWMLATVRAPGGSTWDALHVFVADELRGPWRAHPANPVALDGRCARPAGQVFAHGGALWRPAQDCTAGYGAGLSFCRIDRLTRDTFRQSLHGVARLRDAEVERGPHTLNRLNGREVVDLLGTRKALR